MLWGFMESYLLMGGFGFPCISYTDCTSQNSVLVIKYSLVGFSITNVCAELERSPFSKCGLDTFEKRPPRDAVRHTGFMNFGGCDSAAATAFDDIDAKRVVEAKVEKQTPRV